MWRSNDGNFPIYDEDVNYEMAMKVQILNDHRIIPRLLYIARQILL